MLYLSASNIIVWNGISVVKLVSNVEPFVHSACCVFWVKMKPTATCREVHLHYHFGKWGPQLFVCAQMLSQFPWLSSMEPHSRSVRLHTIHLLIPGPIVEWAILTWSLPRPNSVANGPTSANRCNTGGGAVFVQRRHDALKASANFVHLHFGSNCILVSTEERGPKDPKLCTMRNSVYCDCQQREEWLIGKMLTFPHSLEEIFAGFLCPLKWYYALATTW